MVVQSTLEEAESSAHSLIKALKSPCDPPAQSSLSKIDIASQAWRNSSLYLPNKATFLRDWIIDTWSRTDPAKILDPSYHGLVLELYPKATAIDNAPYALLASYFKTLGSVGPPRTQHQLVARSLRSICANSSLPVKVEQWIQLWASFVEYLASTISVSSDTGLLDLWDLVFNHWKPDVSGDSQKKLGQLLLPTLPLFSRAFELHPELKQDSPSFFYYLLPLGVLQQKDALGAILHQLDSASNSSLSIVPSLFRNFIDLLTRLRYHIFAQSSSSKTSIDVLVTDRVRFTINTAIRQILDFLDNSNASQGERLSSRLLSWREIVNWGGYLETESHWAELVTRERSLALELLLDESSEERVRILALQILGEMELLDHQETRLDRELLGICLAAPTYLHESAEGILLSLIRYHSLTRSLPALIALLDDAQRALFLACSSKSSIRAVYDLVIHGPLFRPTIRRILQQAQLTSQHAQDILQVMQNGPVLPGVGNESDEAQKLSPKLEQSLVAASLGIRSRLVRLLPNAQLQARPVLRTVLQSISEADAMDTTTPAGTKKFSWSRKIMLAARLRLASELRGLESEALDQGVLGLSVDKELPAEVLIELLLYFAQKLVAERSATISLDLALRARIIDTMLDILDQAPEGLVATLWEIMASRGASVLFSVSEAQLGRYLSLIAHNIDIRSPGQSACRRILAMAEAYESDLLLSTSHHSSITFMIVANKSRPEQEQSLRDLVISDTSSVDDALLWASRALSSDNPIVMDNETSSGVLKLAFELLQRRSEHFSALWNAMIRNLCLRPKQSSSMLDKLLEDLRLGQSSAISQADVTARRQARLAALDIVAQAHSAEVYSPQLATILRLAKDELLQLVGPLLKMQRWQGLDLTEKSEVVSNWVVFLRLRRCLGSKEMISSCSSLLLQSGVDQVQAILPGSVALSDILRLEAASPVAGAKLVAFCLRRHIPVSQIALFMEEATLGDYIATLEVAIQALDNLNSDHDIETCISIVGTVISVPKEESGVAVRQSLFAYVQLVASRIRDWPTTIVAVAVSTFRQISEKRPFAIGPNEASLICETILQVLASNTTPCHPALFSDAVSTMINLLRHPHQLVDISIGTAITAVAFPLFARRARQKQQTTLGVEQAGLLSRLLATLADIRTESNAHQAIAKHVVPILIAFVRTAADPRGGFDPDVRRELRSGLLPLCEVLTTGGRVDARGREGEGLGEPFGLGFGPGGQAERDVWADLWTEWSRRRYTGQG